MGRFLQIGGVWVRHVNNSCNFDPRNRLGVKCKEQLAEPCKKNLFWETNVSCRQNSIAAKWNNIFLSFGLKVPFGFPCFAHVCLESWLGLVFFSTAYVTLVVALLFGGLVLLLAFLKGFFKKHMLQILEVLQAVLQEWIGLNEATPCKSEESWNCLRFLLRFAFGLGKVNKTENPPISFM